MDGLINNRYRIIKSLNGDAKTTLLGEDTRRGETVVIKTRHFKNSPDWKVIELFEREIDTLRQIKHNRIPKYIDSFTIEKDNDIEYFLVQEYIEGMTLKDKISSGRVLTEVETINVIREVLDILKYLHSFNPPIIHRDINPSNLLMTLSGEIYLIDFGAVKDVMQYDPNNATIVGTYGYMPIEQTMGRATTSSDIYSLGMTAVFLLTGKNPSKLTISRGKPDLASYCDISPSLIQTINLMIEPVMEDRLQNVEEVYNELRLLKIEQKEEHSHKEHKTHNKSETHKESFKEVYKEQKEKPNNDEKIEKIAPIDYLETNPILRNQTIRKSNLRDLEVYVGRTYVPESYRIKVWKDFDSITLYFKNGIQSSGREFRPLVGSSLILIPLIMMYVYIGIDILPPFVLIAMLVPFFILFMRNINNHSTTSIQLKSTYIKIIQLNNNRPETRIISYTDIKDIFIREIDSLHIKIVILLKTNNQIEIDSNLKKNEVEWIIETCKHFMAIAMNIKK